MANLFLVILSIGLLEASAVRTSDDAYEMKVRGRALCQKQYGSYYYNEAYHKCCPCSPCKRFGIFKPSSDIWCIQIGADHCKAPYFALCKDIGPPLPESRKTSRVVPVTNASIVASPPTDTVTRNGIVVTKSTESSVMTKVGTSDNTFLVILVAISVVILMCVTLAFTSVCCYLRTRGNHTAKLFEKLPKWWGCSDNATHVSSEQNSLSSDKPLIVKESPQPGNGINPSPHLSLISSDGPPEMGIPVAVRPDSRMNSCDASPGGSSIQPTDCSIAECNDNTSRQIVPNRGHPQDVTAYPPGNTTVTGNNNVGLIATVGANVVIHTLNFHCGASSPDHTDFNITNQQIRVEAPRTQRAFHESNQVTRNRLGGPENSLHRQSSEISSHSSGPVESESQASSTFGDSIAFQDQVWQMRNCTQAQKEEHSLNSDSSASGSYIQRSTLPSSSFPTMGSLSISLRSSSGLPPQGDMDV